MLTRPFQAPLALLLVFLTLGLFPSRACGQAAAPVASVADLQLELRRQRKKSDALRSELKRQQKAVGLVRRDLEAQQARVGEQEAESSRLREQAEALRRWLVLLGVVSVAGVALGLTRRGTSDGAPAPLAIAKERTGRLHDGLTALEARIQVIERRSSEG
jgi:hypothetical protein